MFEFKEVSSASDFSIAVELFQEYAAQLGVDLAFQNFEEELKSLESQYSRPSGALFIVCNLESLPMGCFAIRALDASICELKRMYLKKEARGLGVGKQMLNHSIQVARTLGYQKMRLDTLPSMQSAIKLYQRTGFYEIEPYRFNPIEGTKYFEYELG